MDILLKNGDHATDPCGVPIAITEAEEKIQRAILRLCIRRGSFVYDKTLGSELYKLNGNNSEDLNRTAQSYIQEALLPLPEIRVGEVLCRNSGGTIHISTILEYQNQNYQIELNA